MLIAGHLTGRSAIEPGMEEKPPSQYYNEYSCKDNGYSYYYRLWGTCGHVPPTKSEMRQPEGSVEKALVVGFGKSGCSAAHYLVRKGFLYSLYESYLKVKS